MPRLIKLPVDQPVPMGLDTKENQYFLIEQEWNNKIKNVEVLEKGMEIIPVISYYLIDRSGDINETVIESCRLDDKQTRSKQNLNN